MAKFLRIIFNLLLVCYIAAALAIVVPPLVGVATAVTIEGTAGNQELGAVNYAWRTSLRAIQPGDEILVTDEGTVNVYTVQAVDADNTVVTTTENTEVTVRTYVYKMLLTVPYVGYLAIGMQSSEGMIILAAIAGTLLLLCILTAVWCRRKRVKRMEDEEDRADEEETEFFQNLASQKRESDAQAEAAYTEKQMTGSFAATTKVQPAPDEEYEELPEEISEQPDSLPEPAENAGKAEEDPATAEEALFDGEAVRAGEADTAGEEDNSGELPETKQEKAAEQTDPDEPDRSGSVTEPEEVQDASEDELEAGNEEMAVERAVETGNIPGVQAALEAALDTQQIQRHVRRNEVAYRQETEAEQEEAEEIELAMPVHTVDEYLQKAYAQGEDPMVRKDELTGVTYVDYSECI
ncbi:MAG: hypothetical protein Q4B03_03300 [Lachnospiraceae bacterium]|nr:hypothetical protein [Lachnospiraceae bacterium]